MKIFCDKEDTKYSNKKRYLGLCFSVIVDNKKEYYEFELVNNEAIVKFSNYDYLEEVCDEFHKSFPYIYKIYDLNHTFYKEFEFVYLFKLPIKILQPTTFFLSSEDVEKVEEYDIIDSVIPVAIINDEYVCLDYHNELHYMEESGIKMVNCYLSSFKSFIPDLVYICKEQNIRSISSLEVLPKSEYDEFMKHFKDELNYY